jgi:hypothetical protein
LDDDLKGNEGITQRAAFEADPVAGWVERLRREESKKHAGGEEPHVEEDQTGAADETETEDSAADEIKAQGSAIGGGELEPDEVGERSTPSLDSAVQEGVDHGKTAVAEPSRPDEAPMPTVEAPLLVPPAASEPTPGTAADAATTSPTVVPTGGESNTSALGASSLSADDQADLNLLNEIWDRASDLVRARFHARIGVQG